MGLALARWMVEMTTRPPSRISPVDFSDAALPASSRSALCRATTEAKLESTLSPHPPVVCTYSPPLAVGVLEYSNRGVRAEDADCVILLR